MGARSLGNFYTGCDWCNLLAMEETLDEGCHLLESRTCTPCHSLCWQLGFCCFISTVNLDLCECELATQNISLGCILRCVVWNGAGANVGVESQSFFLVGAWMVYRCDASCQELEIEVEKNNFKLSSLTSISFQK